MSNNFSTIKNTGKKNVELDFAEFFGGREQGLMVQLTQGIGRGDPDEPGMIQLTLADTYRTILVLTKWMKEVCNDKAGAVHLKIEKDKTFENTLFEEAVKLEKFIAGLEILEIPIDLLEKIKEGIDV